MAKSRSKAKPIPALVLSASCDIPLDKLVLSQANVRQIKAGVSIEELAEDIARRTLLQSLTVRAVIDESGAETGMYEVPAGGRRFRALQLLVKQKRLASDAPIPCVIRTEGLAEEDSLAENIQRAPLHPLDQFRAFKTLREKGKSEEEIAAAFFVTPAVVKQRLKLAAVAPALLDLYAEDAMSLDQLMAFTVSPDHQRQVDVWAALTNGHNREPYHIRRMLTEGAVRAGDKRALFVGLDAYEAAGGAVLRDLFSDAQDGWLQDAALLNRLVAEKLDAEASMIAAEGWKWIETAADFPYGHTFDLRRIDGERAALTGDEEQALAAAKAEYDALQAEHDGAEELPEDVDARLGELEAIIEAIEERPFRFSSEEVMRAGVFISLDPTGKLHVERGFVRPEDEAPVDADTDSESDATGPDDKGGIDSAPVSDGGVHDENDDEQDASAAIPDRLMIELTEWRTLALRDAVGKNWDVAFLAALHALCLDLFYLQGAPRSVSINARQTPLRSGAAGLANSVAAASIDARHQAFGERLPGQPGALWPALMSMEAATRQALFAHCVGLSIDAVYKPYDRRNHATGDADHLARSVTLDLRAAGWTPTADGYFGRVTKAHILDAVRDAKGAEAADRLAGLKKADMAAAAEELLAPTRWVPVMFRMAQPETLEDGQQPDAAPMANASVDAEPHANDAPTAAIAAE